jgi:type I restriction enzyme S subunit
MYITSKNIKAGYLDLTDVEYIDSDQHAAIFRRCDVRTGDILLTKDGASTGNAALNNIVEEISLLSSVAFLRVDNATHNAGYFLQCILSYDGQRQIQEQMAGNAITRLTLEKIKNLRFPVPPTKHEQDAITEALSDVDALIESLEKLIAKKRAIKQGAMQELLSGRRRLAGFTREWAESKLGEVTECLDYLRIPLNDSQRQQMQGDYPYCGANGILDYIDRYSVEDTVILIAEDGGYFDQYETRPIAYRMTGKFWVNNHAHILKAKPEFEQDFIFYSLVHKNILPFLASGTRAKLNKSEMNKIILRHPVDRREQTDIATALNSIDEELEALEAKLSKARQIKQGMMQELLTGRVRLL